MKTSSEIYEWRRSRRGELQKRRLALGRDDREQRAARVIALLERHVPELEGASIGFYWPFRGEIDLRGLATSLHEAGARLSLPVVVEKNEPLEFWRWEPGTRLARGTWRIPVPAERVVAHPTVLVVPLLGFDEAGYRLGYGAGYYDRTLAAMQPQPFTVGVGYDFGRLATIHPQDHDIPMDAIATESSIVRFDANRRSVTAAGTSAADEERWRVDDEKLNEALKGTFPASDPFSLG
jgi:5-formyltetrahydrofolate cyclo-ligase